jgi:hypothetical protein
VEIEFQASYKELRAAAEIYQRDNLRWGKVELAGGGLALQHQGSRHSR